MGVALLFGGGSGLYPLPRMIVEIAGLGTVGWFAAQGWRIPANRATSSALAIIGLLGLLIALQLVPLPSSVWHSLPGRATEVEILGALGASQSWMPVSITPAETGGAALFLVAPIAMFIATLKLDDAARRRVIMLIAIGAIASMLVAMLQVQGAHWLVMFDTPDHGFGEGIFANKNHQSDFLLVGIIAVASGATSARKNSRIALRPIAVALIALFIVGIVAAKSRFGLILTPVAVLGVLPMLLPRDAGRRSVLSVGGGLLGLCGLAAIILNSGIAYDSLARFGLDANEGRVVFWPNVIYGIGQFWPLGSGIGSFVPVFQSVEPLATTGATYVVHAHCDYLEIALESGAPGVALVGLFLIWFAVVAWVRLSGSQVFRGRQRLATLSNSSLAAVVSILILLVHSAVDYPLRTLSLACIFAFFCATLARPTEPGRSELRGEG